MSPFSFIDNGLARHQLAMPVIGYLHALSLATNSHLVIGDQSASTKPIRLSPGLRLLTGVLFFQPGL
jgi:hypothetical protein